MAHRASPPTTSWSATRLPADLAADEARLRDELAGRRLLLFATARRDDRAAPYPFTRGGGRRARRLGRRGPGAAIGLREHPLDLDAAVRRDCSTALTLDLSHHRYPLLHAVLRATDAVLTD